MSYHQAAPNDNLFSATTGLLLDCGPFESDRELKAVFADERLRPWQDRLPEASNDLQRAELAVAYLLPLASTSGESALVLFLRVLAERLPPEDACHGQLQEWGQRLASRPELLAEIGRQVPRRSLWAFLRQRRYPLAAILLAQAGLAISFFQFTDRFLLPLWSWLGAGVAAAAGIWGWYVWARLRRKSRRLLLPVVATVAFAGIVAWQTYRAAFPRPFPSQRFGIAVAELGEGPAMRRTGRAREISDQVYESLCRSLGQFLAPEDSADPCLPFEREHGPGGVSLRRAGVMPDSQTARSQGQRLQADVVIWGQLLSSGERGATIRFQILETPDRASNPEFPLVLPVTATTAELFASELDLVDDPVALKEGIARQTTVIASFTLGLAAFLALDYPQAVNLLQITAQQLEAAPSVSGSPLGNSLVYYYLGKANHALGRIETGQAWLVRAAVDNPQEPAIPLSLALGHASLGQMTERDQQLALAMQLVEEWLETHPDDPAATYDRATIFQIEGDASSAVLDYEAVIAADPAYFVAYIGLGQAAAAAQQHDKAVAALEKAVALAEEGGSNPGWAYLNLALIEEDAGNGPEARQAFLQALAAMPAVDWMHYYYARFLERQQEMDAALSEYETTVTVSLQKGWAYGQLAGFLRRRGLLSQALDAYQRAVHAAPEDALLQTYLGETYVQMGQVEEALPAFAAAIEKGPELYYPFASFAGVLFQNGDYQRAAEMYERSLALRPADAAVMLNLGQTYQILGQEEKAVALYQQIVERGEQMPASALQAARERLAALGAELP